MPDRLNEKLINIEEKLGGTETVPAYVQDRLNWHLDYIESLIGGGGGGASGKVFTDVTASDWVQDSTYSDFGYKCILTCDGITANSVVEVILSLDDAISNNYAPICETGDNTVTIYSKVNNTIVIPVIKEIA